MQRCGSLRERREKKLNLMLHGRGLGSVSCNSDVKDEEEIQALERPPLPDFIARKHLSYNILGSCDGLLLLFIRANDISGAHFIYIWNPLTGKYKILPQLKSYIKSNVVFGFGRDLATTTDDNTSTNYKVLLLETVVKDSGLSEFEVYMYTTLTNSWKTLSNLPRPRMIHSNTYPIGMKLAHANLHHLAEIDVLDPFEQDETIISFDLKDNKFRELPVAPGTLYSLCTLNGNLCALSTGEDRHLYTLWMMVNYGVKDQECWEKMFSIDSRVAMDKPIRFISPLHFVEDGQILLTATYLRSNDPFLVSYHIQNKKARFLIKCDGPLWSAPVVYEESLSSPNAESTVEEELPAQ